MKHLHIICRYRSKSMVRMTVPLVAEDSLPKLYKVTIGEQPDPDADINYHVPWHSLVNLDRGTSKHVMLYTHVNPTDKGALMDACARADKIVCMSFTGRAELIDIGADPAKLWVIYPGSGDFHFRRRNIGVIGFEQPNGRKRTHILLDLAWSMPEREKQIIQFVLIGSGWQSLAEQLNNAGIAAIYKEMIDDTELNELYGQLDALLVTAYAEGGPLPFLEAWASGVKVFAPRVGFAGDFLEADSRYKSPEDLVRILHNWLRYPLENALLANALDWTQYAVETALVLGMASGESVEIQNGCDRYSQLLPIIVSSQARNLVEIGTWSGARAIQMIQAAAGQHPIEQVSYIGFDLFDLQTGNDYRTEGSKAGWPMNTVWRRLKATGANVDLRTGYTRETLNAKDDSLRRTDLFFIDGGHSTETIMHDWSVVSVLMKEKAIAIFDDYYYGDHPAGLGCNEIIDNLAKCWKVEKLPIRTKTDTLDIGMVQVTHAEL